MLGYYDYKKEVIIVCLNILASYEEYLLSYIYENIID